MRRDVVRNVPYDVLLARVKKRGNRPMLKTDDPEATLRRLIEERYPVYAEADIIIESREVPHDAMADEVIDALKRHFGITAMPRTGG